MSWVIYWHDPHFGHSYWGEDGFGSFGWLSFSLAIIYSSKSNALEALANAAKLKPRMFNVKCQPISLEDAQKIEMAREIMES